MTEPLLCVNSEERMCVIMKCNTAAFFQPEGRDPLEGREALYRGREIVYKYMYS